MLGSHEFALTKGKLTPPFNFLLFISANSDIPLMVLILSSLVHVAAKHKFLVILDTVLKMDISRFEL